MGKTWREYGYPEGGKRVAPERDDWRREYEKEKAMSDSVFIVVNEWTDISGNTGMEILNGHYHKTLESAREVIQEEANAAGVDIPEDETGFTVEGSGSLEYEEFYIQELEAN